MTEAQWKALEAAEIETQRSRDAEYKVQREARRTKDEEAVGGLSEAPPSRR